MERRKLRLNNNLPYYNSTKEGTSTETSNSNYNQKIDSSKNLKFKKKNRENYKNFTLIYDKRLQTFTQHFNILILLLVIIGQVIIFF